MSLVIHQRTPITRNRALIVLVHGLGGRRYGSCSTWRLLPKFLFQEFDNCDIGLYSYRTLFQRLRFSRSRSLEDEAENLAGTIKAEGYFQVVLIGHSLGGLLCKAAIAYLVQADHSVLNRIRGLVLMAAPQLGSLHVSTVFRWISPDFLALQRHGKFVREINRTFTDFLNLDNTVTAPSKYFLPTWAIRANGDSLVDALSAEIGLPSWNTRTVQGNHTSFVKPQSKQTDTYRYVTEFTKISLGKRSNSPQPTDEEIEQLNWIAFIFFSPEGLIESMFQELLNKHAGRSYAGLMVECVEENEVHIVRATKQAVEFYEGIITDKPTIAARTLSLCKEYFDEEDLFNFEGEIGIIRARLLRDLLSIAVNVEPFVKSMEPFVKSMEPFVNQIKELALDHVSKIDKEGFHEIAAAVLKSVLDLTNPPDPPPYLLYASLLLKCGKSRAAMDIFDLYRTGGSLDGGILTGSERVSIGIDWAKAVKDAGLARQRHDELMEEFDKMVGIVTSWDVEKEPKSIKADLLNNRGTQRAVFGGENEWLFARSDILDAVNLYEEIGESTRLIACIANFAAHSIDRFASREQLSELLSELTSLDYVASKCNVSEELFFFYYQKARIVKRQGTWNLRGALAYYESALQVARSSHLSHREPIAKRWTLNLKHQLKDIDRTQYHSGLEQCAADLSSHPEDTWCLQALRETYLSLAQMNETLNEESGVRYSLDQAFQAQLEYCKRDHSSTSLNRLREILRCISQRATTESSANEFLQKHEEIIKGLLGSEVWPSLTWPNVRIALAKKGVKCGYSVQQ